MFYTQSPLEFPLDDSIEVVDSLNAPDATFIVSNVKTTSSVLYAPEINFYLENSQDSLSKKIHAVKALYDVRATIFDGEQDMDFEQEVGDKLLIVTDEACEELKKEFSDDGLVCIVLSPSMIKDVEGHIGGLHVSLIKNDEHYDVETDQILWWNAPLFATKQSGVYDPAVLGLDKAIGKVKNSKGVYRYKNFISYDPFICQYHERREEICGKCAEVCPTVAILKNDEKRQLVFSHIDCHGCGGCISVCPSGALDYTQMPRAVFSKITPSYKNKVALIIPQKMDIESLHVQLLEDVLPLAIEGEKYLHEAHLMNLLQTSGKSVIFYSDFISKGTGDAIRITNEIFERKYHKKAIFVCKDVAELEDALTKAESFAECLYGINEDGLKKREIFSARLAHLVGNEDLGVIKTGEHIHYGDIVINDATCTLCLSCVGACNVRALTAHPEDNSLRFNASICTNCGYCEVTCPEKDCLKVIKDEIHLKPSWFSQRIMAKDTLFTCVECGKPFATTKAIEKISQQMGAIFGDDEVKKRTLYCCADCKPKVMFKAHMEKN